MAKDRKPLGILALLAVSAILVSAFVAVNADAARGGKGGGKFGSGTNSGACSATPDPVAQWSVVTITGSGFAANTTVGYTLSGSGGTGAGSVTTDAGGSFSLSGQVGWLGTNTFTASGGGGSAVCTFEVV
jgi:hypothetical protein